MKEKLIVSLLTVFMIIFLNSVIYGNTFFLYTQEICNNQAVSFNESVREGIMEEIYEAGYIIFDDVSDKKYEIPALLNQILDYGAHYLVVAYVKSEQSIVKNKLQKISSMVDYALYDAKTQKKIGEANLQKEDSSNKTLISRADFFYNLGMEIGKAIEKIFEQYLQS